MDIDNDESKQSDNNTANIYNLPIEMLQQIISSLNIIDIVNFSICSKNNQIFLSHLTLPQSLINNELNKSKPNYKQLTGIIKSSTICANNIKKALDLSKLDLNQREIHNLPDIIQDLIDILNNPSINIRIASSNSYNIFQQTRHGGLLCGEYCEPEGLDYDADDYDEQLENFRENMATIVHEFQTKIANNVPIYVIEWSDGWISKELENNLRIAIDNFANNSSIDHHPHSHNIVRDILHPSLFPLIKQYNGKDYSHLMNNEFNFLGRSFDNLKNSYQWLPVDVKVDNNYNCQFISPLNNLDIQNDKTNKYSQPLVNNLQRLLSYVLKPMERVYLNMLKHRNDSAEIAAVGDDDYIEYEDERFNEYNKSFYESSKYTHPENLRNRNIQVIPKIAEYNFDSNNSKQNKWIGVWHMEAMPSENIILTVVYVLDRSDNIYGGDIIYKRHLFRNEWNEAFEWGQDDFSGYMRSWLGPDGYYGGDSGLANNVESGFCPLGTLPTSKGRCFVFPNYALHKVKEMGVKNGKGKGKRRIIVFFLIDPTIRNTSSSDVPLIAERGISYDEACQHRIKLMEERAQQKKVYNKGMGYSLCEH